MEKRTQEKIIQEIFKDQPWKMFIGCIMLNQTSGKQVKQIIFDFFKKYPTPQSVLNADESMVDILRPLGLYNRRFKAIKNFTYDYMNLKWTDPLELRGIGQYAKDSYEIFVKGNLNVKPVDKVLKNYLEKNR